MQCILEPGGTLTFIARKPATEDGPPSGIIEALGIADGRDRTLAQDAAVHRQSSLMEAARGVPDLFSLRAFFLSYLDDKNPDEHATSKRTRHLHNT